MDSIKTENLLETLHRRVFSCYGLFSSIVNDRERQMMFKLWQKICEKFGINSKLSSTHHSETDDQTENANKVMKNYLKTYVNYAQNDWVDLLPDVEFAANNHENAFTKLTSFFVDHGYHPRSETKPSELYDKCETRKVELIKTDKIVAQQESIRFYLKKNIAVSAKRLTKTRQRVQTTSSGISNRRHDLCQCKRFFIEETIEVIELKNRSKINIRAHAINRKRCSGLG